jgi:hypothetical protein
LKRKIENKIKTRKIKENEKEREEEPWLGSGPCFRPIKRFTTTNQRAHAVAAHRGASTGEPDLSVSQNSAPVDLRGPLCILSCAHAEFGPSLSKSSSLRFLTALPRSSRLPAGATNSSSSLAAMPNIKRSVFPSSLRHAIRSIPQILREREREREGEREIELAITKR